MDGSIDTPLSLCRSTVALFTDEPSTTVAPPTRKTRPGHGSGQGRPGQEAGDVVYREISHLGRLVCSSSTPPEVTLAPTSTSARSSLWPASSRRPTSVTAVLARFNISNVLSGDRFASPASVTAVLLRKSQRSSLSAAS